MSFAIELKIGNGLLTLDKQTLVVRIPMKSTYEQAIPRLRKAVSERVAECSIRMPSEDGIPPSDELLEGLMFYVMRYEPYRQLYLKDDEVKNERIYKRGQTITISVDRLRFKNIRTFEYRYRNKEPQPFETDDFLNYISLRSTRYVTENVDHNFRIVSGDYDFGLYQYRQWINPLSTRFDWNLFFVAK